MENKIAIFKDAETILEVPVSTEEKTVWLNRQQMSVLFDRDVKTIGKHINNAMREELEGQVVVAKFATTTRHGAMEGKTQTKQTEYYNLDVIISVGYRVKSKRGVGKFYLDGIYHQRLRHQRPTSATAWRGDTHHETYPKRA